MNGISHFSSLPSKHSVHIWLLRVVASTNKYPQKCKSRVLFREDNGAQFELGAPHPFLVWNEFSLDLMSVSESVHVPPIFME